MVVNAAKVARQTSGYAVAWRGPDGAIAGGSLELDGADLVLRGALHGGRTVSRRVPLDRVSAVRVGREPAERVRGAKSVILEVEGVGAIAVAPLGAAGAVFELSELVSSLRAG